MDNKNFNADQSIELIQRMIRDTRRNLSSGSSNLFILWGYLLAATRRRDFPPADLHRKSRLAMAVAAALAAGWAATWWYSRRPCYAGQKLHRPPTGTDMGMHSRSGRLFYLRDLHGARMARRPAVPGPAADQRRAFHLGNGDSQQIYVLRFVLPIAGCLRHHPRIVDQCQPGTAT